MLKNNDKKYKRTNQKIITTTNNFMHTCMHTIDAAIFCYITSGITLNFETFIPQTASASIQSLICIVHALWQYKTITFIIGQNLSSSVKQHRNNAILRHREALIFAEQYSLQPIFKHLTAIQDLYINH